MEYSNWYWILLIVLFIGGLCENEGCLEQERVALLQLKSFFNDLPHWEDVKGSNCCEWERVKCSISSKRVIQLSLNQHFLNQARVYYGKGDGYGYLNASLFLPFTELNTLYLNWNHIAGFVDNEGFAKIGYAFKKLEILDLSDNKLNESILTPLSQISSLKSLYLSSNQFTAGSNLTNGIAKLSSGLKKLEILDLSYNFKLNESMLLLSSLSELSSLKSLYLSGIFDELRGSNHTNGFGWLSRLDHLETLDLSQNSLGNDILLHVAALSSLKNLNLGNNQLDGAVNIKELSRMRKLRNLDLSYNGLDNSILGVVSALSNLESLNLGGNRLKGSINIIKELEGLHHLQKLDFSSNELHPNILESIGALTSPKSLTLSNCSLSGPLPAKGWCDLRNLEELDLSRNALEGIVPPCFHNLSSLCFLDISYNHIRVPSSFIPFTNNSHLKFLFIDQNYFVREPTFQTLTKNPMFQLKLLSMPTCATMGLPVEELPNFLFYQYDLRYLDLSYNKFGGEYPSWLLENNTRLQQFLMADNFFKGALQLPKQASVDLFQVDMSQNKMQGPIPMNICSTFPHLYSLFLSQNAFEGNIPPCLAGLKSLTYLDLSFNNFSGGMILEVLGKSNSLKTLRLSNNSLSGKIPPTIFNSSKLRQLYLNGNNFDGEMPLLDALAVSSSYIGVVDLSNNHLSGKLPTWIWNLSNLETLVLSNNHFDGDHIPLELCNLGWLRFLGLSQNNLFGSVPSCFSSLTKLEHLYLSKNKLSGPLPRALYNSSSLVSLDLSHNYFTGNIPNWISDLSALRILILKANHFEGEIPSQICQLKSLSIVDLSQNKLFGQIPSCLSNFTLEPTDIKSFRTHVERLVFTIIVLSDTQFEVRYTHSYPHNYVEEQVLFTTKKGLRTYSGNILDYMSGIDLSFNMLSGQIPPEIGNMSELRSLNLSHNSLTGFIPATFSKLKQVESLDLSHNKLSGVIPIQLMELNFLAVFNVSYNNLSGSIPHEKAQFGTFDESSYLENPVLCGPPKHESCTNTGSVPKTPNASADEEESGILDKHAFYTTFVVSYIIVLMTIGVVLYINPHWRRTWFYFVGRCSEIFYYFIVDNVLGLSIFRRSS